MKIIIRYFFRFFVLINILFAFNIYAQTNKIIKVGTISGSDAQIIEVVKKVAKSKFNLDIKIIEMAGINLNETLNSGDIDVNAFQHQPYFDEQVPERKYKIISIANTYISPIGIYSKKINNLKGLKSQAKIGIPNDPTNTGRALLLLQELEILKLKENIGLVATPLDIIDNPKNLNFIEILGAQLPRSLNDLDIAIINSSHALNGGLFPMKDSIAIERKDSPYVNILAIHEKNKNQSWVEKLIKSYQSEEVAKFINETFNGAIIPSF